MVNFWFRGLFFFSPSLFHLQIWGSYYYSMRLFTKGLFKLEQTDVCIVQSVAFDGELQWTLWCITQILLPGGLVSSVLEGLLTEAISCQPFRDCSNCREPPQSRSCPFLGSSYPMTNLHNVRNTLKGHFNPRGFPWISKTVAGSAPNLTFPSAYSCFLLPLSLTGTGSINTPIHSLTAKLHPKVGFLWNPTFFINSLKSRTVLLIFTPSQEHYVVSWTCTWHN